MLDRLLPARLDNTYSGHKLALWLFGAVAVLKIAQSVSIILAGPSTAQGADGIPLDTFTAESAQSVVAIFAQGSLWRLLFCSFCLLALVRYRSAVPLLFVLLMVQYLVAQVIFRFVPLVRVGSPPGPYVNLAMFIVMVIGLPLSLWDRGSHRARVVPGS